MKRATTKRPIPRWTFNLSLLERDRQEAMMMISEIAEQLDMSRIMISAVFNGRSSSIATLRKIAKLFKKKPERYLIRPTPPVDPTAEDL